MISFGGHLPCNWEKLSKLSKMEYLSLGDITSVPAAIINRKPLVSCHLDMCCYCERVMVWKLAFRKFPYWNSMHFFSIGHLLLKDFFPFLDAGLWATLTISEVDEDNPQAEQNQPAALHAFILLLTQVY